MTDFAAYCRHKAAAMEARATSERIEAAAAAVDPAPDMTEERRAALITAAEECARSYLATAQAWRRMAEDEERRISTAA